MQYLIISTAVLLDPDLTMPIAGGGDSDPGPRQIRCYGRRGITDSCLVLPWLMQHLRTPSAVLHDLPGLASKLQPVQTLRQHIQT